MYGDNKYEMQCSEFEALMFEALDHELTGAKLESFRVHLSQCLTCAPVYREAEAGMKWLHVLKTEQVEPPARLVENILHATSGFTPAEIAEVRSRKSWIERLRSMPALAPVFQTVLQPRFATSFAMAFFSVSMLLTIAGVKVTDIRYVDLRPSNIVREFNETTGKVEKYYDNIRFVYEVESRIRELKRVAGSPEETPQSEKPKKDNTTGEPDHEKYRNYSQGDAALMMARAHTAIRQDTASTDRRTI